MSKSYLGRILAVPKEGCHGRSKPCCNDIVIKKSLKSVFFFLCYHLKVALRSLSMRLLFCMLRRILRILVKKYCFLLSLFRKMLMSAFLLRFKANKYLTKCVATPTDFSFWIPIAFAKIYFFRMVPIWRQKLHTY